VKDPESLRISMFTSHDSPNANQSRLRRQSTWNWLGLCLGAVLLSLIAPAAHALDDQADRDKILDRIDRTENVLTMLSSMLPKLAKDIQNMSLPGMAGSSLFSESVTFDDLDASGELKQLQSVEHVEIESNSWAIDHEYKTRPAAGMNLWRPFLDTVTYFDFASFYNIDGDFTNEAEDEYESISGFKSLAILKDGTPTYATAKLLIHWVRVEVEGEEKPTWRISALKTKKFQTMDASKLLFKDVLDTAIPDANSLKNTRHSIHEKMVLTNFLEGKKFKRPHKYFNWPANDRHPGLAVVDLNQDGFDDFYLMARWGVNQFFMNKGDGTFVEVAKQLGLDIRGHCSAAFFADFDNDGDLDAMIGRTLRNSIIMENIDGKFVDQSKSNVDAELPGLVSSINVVDYDNDGLLDVYFSTYAAQMVFVQGINDTLEFLPKEIKDETLKYYNNEPSHRIKNRLGPPNLLYKNVGEGRFELVKDIGPLDGYRNTFQSTWADFDEDGDADVYIANDFSLNLMIRNDGDGKFTDITTETGTADVGFGMGAAWGDYDNDGQQDLYVTNMFSKAGRRITTKAGKIGKEFEMMAQGNSLFRNQKGQFELVSGDQDTQLHVSAAGWSWGGQFLDVDNDSNLDIYAMSGFYTAPKEVAIAEDT
jgi:hypothetical protein